MQEFKDIEGEQPPLNLRFRTALRWVLAGLVVLGSVGVVGLYVVYPKLKSWRRTRLIQTADSYLAQSRVREAVLLLEQSTQVDPENFAARARLAAVYDAAGLPEAVEEWERLVELRPNDGELRHGLAQALFNRGMWDRLPEALAELHRVQPGHAGYHRLRAAMALVRGDRSMLLESVDALVRLDPNSELMRFTAAALRTSSPDRAEAEAARAELEQVARGDRLRIRATVALIEDAPLRWPAAVNSGAVYARLAQRILVPAARDPMTAALPRDNAYREPLNLTGLIAHMEGQTDLEPADILTFERWMLAGQRVRELLVWLETLPEPARSFPATRMAVANCAVLSKDWPRLEPMLDAGAWGAMPVGAIRQAFLGRRLREEGDAARAWTAASRAITLTGASANALRVLSRLGELWDWPEFREKVLWTITRQFPENSFGWRNLTRLALARKDAEMLARVYAAWTQRDNNPEVQAEFLAFTLLNRPAEAAEATPRTEALFREHPDALSCRLARSLALWRAGQAAEALAVLDGTVIDYRHQPVLSLVRGILLADLGRQRESADYLRMVPEEQLFPAEKQLLDAARAREQHDVSTPP